MATPNYDINYDDERFAEVNDQKEVALKESNEIYDSMISQTDKLYQDQIAASKEYAETQKQNQQAATDFAIEEINQQKAQAEKGYTKEQAGSYADYQKQIDPYGVQAEQVAASGLSNSGYAESLKTQAYVAYQNRVASSRESYQRAVLNYNNAITQARLQNNAVLAEIAYQALQQQLELSLAGFQYKNTLILDKLSTQHTLDDKYYSRYQDVLRQLEAENNSVTITDTGGITPIASTTLPDNQKELYDKQSWKTKVDTMSKLWSNQRDVVSFLQQNGFEVPFGMTPMTREDWNNGKNNGNSSAEYKYSSYTEYLKGYALWYIENSL